MKVMFGSLRNGEMFFVENEDLPYIKKQHTGINELSQIIYLDWNDVVYTEDNTRLILESEY